MTISSAMRDRWTPAIAVGNRIYGVAGRLAEAERLRRPVPVDRKAGAGKRSGAQRALVHAQKRVMRAPEIAAEHLHIGHQMMAERDGLGRLQMREAGHDGLGVFLGAVEQRADQGRQRRAYPLCLPLHPEPEIDGHLVVTRTRCVQPAGRRSDQFGKPRFNVHMDVLELSRELERTLVEL
jgi:hypothetical protein